jgi:hypothetical protein
MIYIRSLSSLEKRKRKEKQKMEEKNPRKEERNGELIGGNSKTEGNENDEKKRDQSEFVVEHGR